MVFSLYIEFHILHSNRGKFLNHEDFQNYLVLNWLVYRAFHFTICQSGFFHLFNYYNVIFISLIFDIVIHLRKNE